MDYFLSIYSYLFISIHIYINLIIHSHIAILFSAIPGYYVFLRLLLPLFQTLIIRQYQCARQIPNSNPEPDVLITATFTAVKQLVVNPEVLGK